MTIAACLFTGLGLYWMQPKLVMFGALCSMAALAMEKLKVQP